MRKNFKRVPLNEKRLQKDIRGLIKQYSRKATSGDYTKVYLDRILETIERKKKLMGKYLYVACTIVMGKDPVGRDIPVGMTSHGPALKHEDDKGTIKYLSTYDPPKDIRFKL